MLILSKTKKVSKPVIQQIITEDDKKDPVYIYNSSKVDLLLSEYVPYKKSEYLDEDTVKINHHLEELSLNIVGNIPPKEKDHGLEQMYRGKALIEKGRKLSTVLERSAAQLIETSLVKNISNNSKKASSRLSNPALNQNLMFLIGNEKLHKNFSLDDYSNTIIFDYVDKMDYQSLNHYFLNSEDIISRALKIEVEEPKVKPIGLDINKQINKIFTYDTETKTRKFVEWSGEEVLDKEVNEETFNYYNNLIKLLENLQIIIWPQK